MEHKKVAPRNMTEWLKLMNLEFDKVLWKTDEFAIFRAKDGSTWRYMPGFHAGWPFIIKE